MLSSRRYNRLDLSYYTLRVGEDLHALLEESVRAFQCTETPAVTGHILKALLRTSKSFKSRKDIA